MKTCVLFAGTTEGRRIAELFRDVDSFVNRCVLPEFYGIVVTARSYKCAVYGTY